MPKIEYGYEPRQVIFFPPTDCSGKFRTRSVIRRRGKPKRVIWSDILFRWNGGGYERIKKLDPNIPTQVGNMDWGFTPAVLK
jgi:hypothetical protein